MAVPVRKKYVNESRTHTFDFTNKLTAGDALTGAASITHSAGITVSNTLVASPVVTTRISGGTVGSEYLVKCEISTTLGDRLELRTTIEVSDDAN